MDILMSFANLLYPSIFALIVVCLSTILFLMSQQNPEERNKIKVFGRIIGIITFIIAVLYLILIVYLAIRGNAGI